jgi:hypothetical protein
MFENKVKPNEANEQVEELLWVSRFKFDFWQILKEQNLDNEDPELAHNVERVYTTLKQIVRDWTAEGQSERDSCYGLIISELKNLYPDIQRFIKTIKKNIFSQVTCALFWF